MITSLRTRVTATAAVGALMLATATADADADAARTTGGRSTPAGITVPPIHESFSQQTCPAKATTTLALEACAGDRVLGLDRQIDRLDSAIVARLPAGGQRQFATAAREWLSYRNTVSRAAASSDDGGTVVPLVMLGALQAEDAAHISALTREFTSTGGQRP